MATTIHKRAYQNAKVNCSECLAALDDWNVKRVTDKELNVRIQEKIDEKEMRDSIGLVMIIYFLL